MRIPGTKLDLRRGHLYRTKKVLISSGSRCPEGAIVLLLDCFYTKIERTDVRPAYEPFWPESTYKWTEKEWTVSLLWGEKILYYKTTRPTVYRDFFAPLVKIKPKRRRNTRKRNTRVNEDR